MDHEPDPKFVEHLEWQIRSSLRRRDRFAMPVPSGALRVARTAALVLLSLMGGAGAVVAAERIQDSRARELLLAQKGIEVEMAEIQLEFLDKSLLRRRQRVDLRVARPSKVFEAETKVVRAEAHVNVLHIDLEEIALTGERPRNEISAPLVRGRDFLTLRLQARVPDFEKQVEVAERTLERLRELEQSGMVSARDLIADKRRLADARGELDILRRRISIRGSFLRGEFSAEHVQLLDLEATTARRLQMAKEEREPLGAELEFILRLAEVGLAADDAPTIRLELELLEGRIELLQLELAALREKLGR